MILLCTGKDRAGATRRVGHPQESKEIFQHSHQAQDKTFVSEFVLLECFF